MQTIPHALSSKSGGNANGTLYGTAERIRVIASIVQTLLVLAVWILFWVLSGGFALKGGGFSNLLVYEPGEWRSGIFWSSRFFFLVPPALVLSVLATAVSSIANRAGDRSAPEMPSGASPMERSGRTLPPAAPISKIARVVDRARPTLAAAPICLFGAALVALFFGNSFAIQRLDDHFPSGAMREVAEKARSGDIDGLRSIAARGVSLDDDGVPGGVSPLRFFILNAEERAVHALLTAGAKVDQRGPVSDAAEAARESSEYILREVLSAGGSAAFPDPAKGMSPLRASVEADHPNFLEILVKSGADPNERGLNGQTALQFAIEQRNARAAMALLDLGSDPRIADDSGIDAHALYRNTFKRPERGDQWLELGRRLGGSRPGHE